MNPHKQSTASAGSANWRVRNFCIPSLSVIGDDFTVYTEGDELYAAMLESIKQARHTINLESYIFANDEIGQHFIEALASRANEGLTVQLMVDAVGSFGILPRKLEKYLEGQGVRVKRFRPWSWRQPLNYNRRDHRKLLVVDSGIAFLGGFNIHRECSFKYFGEKRWRDTHVSVVGDLARYAGTLFDAAWSGKKQSPQQAIGNGGSILLTNTTRSCRKSLECLYQSVFKSARHYIYITTPYFVPSRKLRCALMEAAGRKVEVILMVPAISDIKIARWAASALYGVLIQADIKIFEYRPRLLHAKTIVSDDNQAVIGSANMDYRSLFINNELVLISRDPQLCGALKQQFSQDVSSASPLSIDKWQHLGMGRRIMETVSWSFRRWL